MELLLDLLISLADLVRGAPFVRCRLHDVERVHRNERVAQIEREWAVVVDAEGRRDRRSEHLLEEVGGFLKEGFAAKAVCDLDSLDNAAEDRRIPQLIYCHDSSAVRVCRIPRRLFWSHRSASRRSSGTTKMRLQIAAGMPTSIVVPHT